MLATLRAARQPQTPQPSATRQPVCLDIHIRIVKRIPSAAGLAGGSSDAAATLSALNEIFQSAGMSGATVPELMDVAERVGADVPFCLAGWPAALAKGIGEKLEPLPPLPPRVSVVLANPNLPVGTAWVFSLYSQSQRPAKETKEATEAKKAKEAMEIAEAIEAIEAVDARVAKNAGSAARKREIADSDILALALKNQPADFFASARAGIFNDLEAVTVPARPAVGELKELMLRHGAEAALMSGSGATVFGLFSAPKQAADAQKDASGRGFWSALCDTGER
jgi:4-diphosphocytidyl-2-C-methyl-D-erythritol kinase